MTKIDILYKLWEIILLNKSMLALTDSPDVCSELIFSLTSLIFPIEFCGSYSPYFTIFDPAFNTFKDNSNNIDLIIGITNPLILNVIL